jgi:inosine/xanthosine triphosphatase
MSVETATLTIAVASKNPVKNNAAKKAFELVFQCDIQVLSVDAASGVADQPMSYQETHLGAQNRTEYLVEQAQAGSLQAAAFQADYFIAYEGGVDVFEDGPKTFAIVCISNGEDTIFGQSAMLPLPLSVYEKLLEGTELGDAMDALFDTVNIKQKGGAIGQLTNGIETRESVYTSATILALSRFVNKDLFE